MELKWHQNLPPARWEKRPVKGITIRISPDGGLRVTSSAGVQEKAVRELLQKREPWIRRHLERMEEVRTIRDRILRYGDAVLFRGKNYVLEKDCSSEPGSVRIRGERLLVSVGEPGSRNLKDPLYVWYRRQAEDEISARVRAWQSRFPAKAGKVSIRNQKSRWGSCSARGNLSFNWRLILAPPEILDYVVVHEMAHLLRMNHSVQFWSEVEALIPDYMARRRWLRDHGHLLEI